MSLATFEDTPNLSMHKYPSAALLAGARRNLIALDAVTRQGRPAYCGGYGHHQERTRINPYRESWGSFRAIPGLTTITVISHSSDVDTGDTLRLYLNGVLSHTWTLANGTQTHSAAVGSYTTNSVVHVVFEIHNPSKITDPDNEIWGTFEISDAYVGPVGLADPFPGTPTWAAAYAAAELTQLADSIDWLTRRVALRTEPLFQSVIRFQGPHQGLATCRWHGGVTVTPSTNKVKATGVVRVLHAGATEQIRLIVAGAVVGTYAVPSTVGDHFWSITYTYTEADGTHLPIAVDYIRTVTPPAGFNAVNEWTLQRVESFGDSSLFPAPAIPVLPARTLIAWSELRAGLNALSSAAADIKARIDANPDLWDRQRLYRRRYANDDYQDRVFEPGMIATQQTRRGEALLVSAAGGTVAWGPAKFSDDEKQRNEVGLYKLDNLNTHPIAQGAELTTELLYLDNLGSLYPSAPYNVRGETLAYAGEILLIQTNA